MATVSSSLAAGPARMETHITCFLLYYLRTSVSCLYPNQASCVTHRFEAAELLALLAEPSPLLNFLTRETLTYYDRTCEKMAFERNGMERG